MAVQDLATNLSAALSQLYEPKLVRQWNRLSVLAAILGPAVAGRGKNVGWDVEFSAATAETFTDGADAANFDVDTPVAASLPWGLYRKNFSVSGLAQAAAMSSAESAEELIELIDSSAENAAEKLCSFMNADLFAGDGTSNKMVGLATALSASGTYATIAKGTYAEWQGNVLANGGTARPLTKDLMDQLEAKIFVASGKMPRVIVASAGVVRKYEGIFDSLNRNALTPGEISAIQARGSMAPILPDQTGWTGLSYKGIPVFRDRDCQTGTLYMLNTSDIKLRFLPQGRITTAAMVQERELHGVEGGNPTGTFCRLEALAKTGDADKFTLKVYPQLQVKRVNSSGILQDISET